MRSGDLFELARNVFQHLGVGRVSADEVEQALDGFDRFVTGKMLGKRPRDAFVENNPHAASRVASESSKIWQAISLLTNGKHSRNSSRL